MNAKLHYNTTNEMKTHFDNLLKQLSYSSFIENDDFVNILNTNKEKITEFGDFTSINNYYIKYKISFPNAENYGLGGPTVSTRFWKLVYPIISWLNNKEKQHKINNECLEIINQLQKYGLYSHFKIDDKYNYTIDDIKRLTKELEEYETAEENIPPLPF
jgi:hypothetical protein